MPDPNEIKKQTHMKSENVTPEEAAAKMSKADKWAPHVSDGLDALENAISKVELKKWSKVVAEAWTDDKFKERLMRDPASALKEFEIHVPAGIKIKVVENTDKVRYITLPPKPTAYATELDEKELRAVAAAFTSSTTFMCRRPPTWADTWIIITA
jgi:hypothetical protein